MPREDARTHLKRFSVSIPDYLYEWGETERKALRLDRSQFVAYLYQRLFEECEYEQRLARYVAAYAKVSETPAERSLGEIFLDSVDK
jgi:metal-responsive CopG/Arc/MetJ family transcriptional regulator